MSSIINSLIESLESGEFIPDTDFGDRTIRATVTEFVSESNKELPEERHVSLELALEVAERSLTASANRDDLVRKYLAIRDVARYISVAAEGSLYGNTTEFSDLLPAAHPLSTAAHTLTASALREARAAWVASDPRIDASIRPVVAAAYAASPESAERVYYFTRLSAANSDLVPLDVAIDPEQFALVAAFNPYSGGNSFAARSARARAQRRDSKGQFAEMGGGIRSYLKDKLGKVVSKLGRVVGYSSDGSSTQVEYKNDKDIPNGIYSIPTAESEAIQGFIPEEGLKNLPDTEAVDQTIPATSLEDFLATKMDAPSGWTIDPTYKKQAGGPDKVYKSEDGYIVEAYDSLNKDNQVSALMNGTEIAEGAKELGAGKGGKFVADEPVYVLKRDASIYKGPGETEVVSRSQSWAGVQTSANDDNESFDKAIADAPEGLANGATAETGPTAEDYVSAIQKKSKINPAAVDKALSTFIEQNPDHKFSANFEGDPDNATAELIGRLAKGTSQDDVAMELSGIMNDLPQDKNFAGLRKAVGALMDSVIEFKLSDLKKDESKGEKIAELPEVTVPGDEGGEPPVEVPSQIDAMDAPKPFDYINKDQLDAVKPGEAIVLVTPKTSTEYHRWITKQEDGTYLLKAINKNETDKTYTAEELFAEGNKVVYAKDFHAQSSEDSVEDLSAKLEEAKAARAAYTGNDKHIQGILKQNTEWIDSMKFFAQSKITDQKNKAAYEAHEGLDWTTMGPGDEANSSFINNAPIGTKLNTYELDERLGDFDVEFEKVGDDKWVVTDPFEKYWSKDGWTSKEIHNQFGSLGIVSIPEAAPSAQEGPKAPTNLDGYKQVSGPKGSNDGGIFEDENGNQVYLKFPKSQLHGENEVLATEFYKALGISAADIQKGTLNGEEVTFSPILPNSKADFAKKVMDADYRRKVQEGFAVDAWLANWDVAGTGFDNIMTDANGEPVRVDPGGALLFRAQGAPKGDKFGNEANEIDTFVDGSNDYTSMTFSDMSEEEKKESAKKLLNISDEQIDALVNNTITDPNKAEELATKLKARRDDILDRFGLKSEAAPAEVNAPAEADEPDALDESPAEPGVQVLEGYTLKQNANGVWYPEEKLTADDFYALRNGTKIPAQFPFIPSQTLSGDTLYFDAEGNKRWGQYGAAGSLIRRKNEDGSFEYLVVKRNAKAATDGGVWSIPGGAHDSQDDAATPQSTAARELKEEMGWKLPADVTPSMSHKEQVSSDWAYDYEMFDIEGDLPQNKLSKEITETKWVSADELKQMSQDGDLHSAISADLVDKLVTDSEAADFAPVSLQTGKWWTPDFNEDGTQKAFRKDKSSTIKKGDIVTVKGATGERDVIVSSDPQVDGDKVIFDILNPENDKAETYTWKADSDASILSNNKSAQDKLSPAATPEAVEEAPEAESQAPTLVTESTYTILSNATDLDLEEYYYSDGSSNFKWGLNSALVYSYENGTFAAIHTDSQGVQEKATFETKKAATAWVGDIVAAQTNADTNPITKGEPGDASQGVTVHKKGFLNSASPAQLSKVEKLLGLVEIDPESKAKFELLLNEPSLTHGEIGSVIGKLMKMPTLPRSERQKPQAKDLDAEVSTETLDVADGGVEQTTSTVGESSSYSFSQDGKTVAEVAPSVHKSGAWDASTVADDGTVSKETLNSKDSALGWVGEAKTAEGAWTENPFTPEVSGDKVEGITDNIVPEEENNDLTPKNAFDTISANLVMDELLLKHPDHKILPNGDVVIKETTFTNKYGKSFKYEVIVRRTKRERFFTYIKETDLQTGNQRVLRAGKEHHSYKALENAAYRAKKNVNKADPRTWFNKQPGKQEFFTVDEAEVFDITPGLQSYIENPETPKDAASLANGIADFIAGMGANNVTVNKDVLDALTKSAGLHPGFVDQVLDIMAENKAKAASGLPDSFFDDGKIPGSPHVSYNGGPAVKKGDYVDWTDPKTGKVYRGYVQHIIYNHNSKDYLYSDQTLVVFPDLNTENGYPANWQRWRVSSNLIVVDKTAPMSQPFSPKALEKITQEDIVTGETPNVPTPRFVKNKPLPTPLETNNGFKMSNIDVDGEPVVQKDNADGSVEFYVDGNEAGSVTFDETYKQWSSNDPFSSMGDLHPTKEAAIKHNLETVIPQSIDEFKKQEAEQEFLDSTSESVKKPAPQTDEAPKVEVSENGISYVEIDGVKHPLYNNQNEIATHAIASENTPKKWSQLEAGDLIHIGGKWTHVVASGTGEDGVFRITTSSVDAEGNHTIKTISLNEGTKKFLDSYSTATVRPENAMIPGAVSLEKESDPTAPASDESFDALLKYEGLSSKVDAQIAELTGKKLFGDGVTQGEVDDLLAELKNSGAKQKVSEAPTVDEVVESVQILNEELQTSEVSQEMDDATAKTIADAETVKANPITGEPTPATVSQVLDDSQFADLGAIPGAEVLVGDVLRYGLKGKYNYFQVQGTPNADGKVKVLNLETGFYKFIKPNDSKNKAYRPIEGAEPKVETSKVEVSKAEPTNVTVSGEVTTFPDVEKATNAATDKKSEAGYAQLGIPLEIDGVSGSSIGYGADEVSLWKLGFNDAKVKVGNDKYVIPGGVVQTPDEKQGGVVVDTHKDNNTLDIMWVSGDKAGTLEKGVPAANVQDTNHWMSPETAANNGIKVDTTKIDAGKKLIADKIAMIKTQYAAELEQKKKQAELDALKFKDWVEGSGVEDEAHTADVPTSWDETANAETPSLQTVLKNVHGGNMENQAAAMGQEVLVDAADIEDNRVRVSVIQDKSGNKQTRLMFTLTAWAGNASAKAKIDDPNTKKQGRLAYRRLVTQGDGTLVDGGAWQSGYLNGDGNGQTFETPVLDADGKKIGTVYLHRANKTDKSIKHLGSEYSQATSYHNKVDVVLDGEATPQQIEAALLAAGVTAARPASTEDIRRANENKLISIFAEKNDGNKNFKGELRKKALENIEATYGVKAEDMEVEFSSNGDINFLLPEAVGKKVAELTGTKTVQHAWMSSLPNAGKARAEFIVNLIKSTGLRPTTFRWAYGIDTSGMSSKSDGTGVGANYVFTKKTGKIKFSGGSNLGFVFDANQMFRRLDWYANQHDHGNGPKGDKNQIKEASNSSVYEIPFKNGISWTALQSLYIGDASTREQVLEMLKAQGITMIGNTPIEKLIKG